MSPLQQFRPPPPPQGSLKAAIDGANAAAGSGGGGGGGGGFSFGGLASNVLGGAGQAALFGLEAIQYPMRATIASADMVGSAVTGKEHGGNQEWLDQVTDETFGTGDYVDTGNEWFDRILGFTGDVALDPLTYATFGVGKAAGAAGRASLAAKVASQGGKVDDVGKAARLGLSSFDDVTREALGYGGHGVRLGTKNNNVIIPGTRKLARGVGEGLNRTRAKIGDTALGRGYRSLRTPTELATDIEILTGRATGDVMQSAARVYADDVIRMGEGTVANMFGKQMRQWDKLSSAERVALTHSVEGGAKGVGRDFYDELFDALSEAGATGVKKRDNYVIHSITDEMRAFAKGDAELSKLFKVDKAESGGLAFARKLEPGGTYTIQGQKVTLGDASIADINDKFGAILGFKVMEDDFAKLSRMAVMSTAQDAGMSRGLLAIKEKFPDLARRLDESGDHLTQTVNKSATKKAAKKEAKRFEKLVNRIEGEIKTNKGTATANTREAKSRAVAYYRDTVDQLKTVKASTKRALRDLVKQESDAGKTLAKLDKKFDNLVKETDRKLLKAQKRLDDARKAVNDPADPRLVSRADKAKAGSARRVSRKKAIKDMEQAVSDLEDDLAKLDEIRSGGSFRGDEHTRTVSAAKAGDRFDEAGDSLAANSGPLHPDDAVRRAEIDAEVNDAMANLHGVESEQAAKFATNDAEKAIEQQRAQDALDGWMSGNVDLDATKATLAAAKDDLASVKGLSTGSRKQLQETRDELESVIALTGASNDPELQQIVGLLEEARLLQLEAETTMKWNLSHARAWTKSAKAGNVQPVMMDTLADGWNRVGKQLFDDADGLVIKQQLAESFKNLVDATADGKWVSMLDEYTKFFKTYATMSPGFHFRNAMSATFMNYSDGVGTIEMVDSIKLWKKFRNDPQHFLSSLADDDPVRKAFEAVFGSGAGGNFSIAELGDASKWGRMTNNVATRASRRAGEWVEGPARLAMALDTVKRGGDSAEALARITRIHFDYAQMSKFDRKMKRIIPFWTFMSRNLPLQMQQMWMKPKAYSHYASFVRNFDAGEEGDIVPLNWRERGAFNTGFSIGGNAVMAAPDLPFTRLQSELEKLSDPMRLAADFNPLLRVPAELAANKKAFSGREFYDDENKLLYALLNMAPAASQVDRLTGGEVTGAFGGNTDYREDKQASSIAGYLGIPAMELTPKQLEYELRRLAAAEK